jgi:hypothetical protein
MSIDQIFFIVRWQESYELRCSIFLEDGVFVPFEVSVEGKEYRCFEDCKRTLEEFKSLFFNTLYL